MKSRIAIFPATVAVATTGIGAPIASAQAATGTAGGGNCGVWASMKEAMFGVHCSFYMRP